MTLGLFDTHSDALKRRMASHDRYGKADLNAWIFDQLQPSEGQRILDLGCGLGKQSLPLAEIVGATGGVVSVDVSPASLAAVDKEAESRGVAPQLRTVHANLDEVEVAIGSDVFDRVVASYSLYYTTSAERLFSKIHACLRPGATFFFCGPTAKNNGELKALHYGLKNERPAPTTGGAAFMEGEGLAHARARFASTEATFFENPLRFASADALYEYWSNYNLYDPDIDEAFQDAARKHFENHESFETIKRVIGVRAVK